MGTCVLAIGLVEAGSFAEETTGPRISVEAPGYGASIRGDTRIELRGRGFDTLNVKCWMHGGRFGTDSTVGVVRLDDMGRGFLIFPADRYPHGPANVRIHGETAAVSDNCYLQLFNEGGVAWNEGIPGAPPPAAKNLKLVFADDFDGELSISHDGRDATYSSHKLGGGDFSAIPFGNHEDADKTPFLQRDTYLRIRADEEKNATGLLCSVRSDGSGVSVRAPCYFECRFVAQSAPGTWPAFWIMTNQALHDGPMRSVPSDELDVIEAYGGEGPGRPNSRGRYMIATHYWLQGDQPEQQPGFYGPIDMRSLNGAGGASWWETLHVYGVLVGLEDTVYYCDDIEVARHKTARLSRQQPFYFYVNLALGGGWKHDLSRYGGIADMYVDYVRVYAGEQ